MTLCDRIDSLCAQNSVKRGALERELGFGRGSIMKWDSHIPQADRLYAVAKYFNVSMEYLMTGDDLTFAPAADDAPPRLSPDEEDLLRGYRVASGPVRKIMLDAARDALKGEGGERLLDSFGDAGA